jgi:metal-responsive CopG/Arc/MetJ family transcriptional regulator
MQQLVVRVADDVAAAIDELVAEGIATSRSDAVRTALLTLIQENRRRRTGEAIVAGYRRLPQDEDDLAWSDDATRRMIADEPW